MTVVTTVSKSYLVVRSAVAIRKTPAEYRQNLRLDFWFTCAYCTVAETEAAGIAFEIDHYEPTTSRPDLAAVYNNLMYSCEHCNKRKLDWSPPTSARNDGLRFFKADVDNATDHFALEVGDTISGTTTVGKFTVKMLDLNRLSLTRLRAVRKRIGLGLEASAFGLRVLLNLPPDKLSTDQRIKLGFAKHERKTDSLRIQKAVMSVVRSEMLDEDPEAEARSAGRREHLADWRVLYPEPWSARPRKKTP